MTDYPELVTEAAKQYGFKAANLMFIKGCIEEFKQEYPSNTNTVAIPSIKAIADENITAHLKTHIPNFDSMWSEFCTLQKGQDSIGEDAKKALDKLQIAISQSFIDHPFLLKDIPSADKLMVRSTGEEDRVDVANPGGNESVASLEVNLSASIGTVIASYVSEQSLLQRLKLGENITSKFPLSPCLIQSMVGGTNGQNQPTSGVIFTDNEHVRIQASPGHGELIVNSKGNFDNYYITPQGKTYAEIRDKHIRLTPKMNAATGKMEQVEEDNDFSLATNSSINEETAGYLHNLAKFIEQKYGMRMDIEFVYDSSSKTVNIVQARAIPEGDRKGLRPSALSTQFISENKPKNLKSIVITPDINSSSVIENSNQILICNTIEEAKDIYLKSSNQIKMVIIKKEAPDTSHEAGLFTTKAITVLQMDNIEEAKQWVASLDNNVMVCDPQHKKLYQIPKVEYSEDFIKDGIYASTLSPYVTPFKRGTIAVSAILKAQEVIRTNVPEQRYTGALLRKHLDSLATPQFGENALAQKDILANLLKFNARKLNENKISANLFKEIMLAGVELRGLIDEMHQETYNEDKSKYYLNVFEKFNGLITSQKKKDVLSSSIIDEMHASKTQEKYEKIASELSASKSNVNLTSQQKELFLEVVKLDKFIINPENRKKWQEFCFDSCQKNIEGLALATLSKDLVKFGLHEYFLNTSFIKAHDEDKKHALRNLYQEFDKGRVQRDILSSADKIINRMEHQIPEWSQPEKFETLHADLQKDLNELSSLLQFDTNQNLKTALEDKLNGTLIIGHLNKLVDVIDLSMKSLQNSSLYNAENKAIQVKNFGKLVEDFDGLMGKLIVKPETKQSQIHSIHRFIKSKKNSESSRELDVSQDFTPIAANIYQEGRDREAQEGFSRGFDNSPNKTLADAHTP